MDTFKQEDHPHRRLNPLTGEYVLVSPHRAKRPWQGQIEKATEDNAPNYDDSCFLCPTNERITGEQNPNYQKPFVFTNDFSALSADTPEAPDNNDDLFSLHSVKGTSRVICYSPDHSATMPEMSVPQIRYVVDEWINQYRELNKNYQWVQVFENKGAINGCSNPHPHGQIWASSTLPSVVAKEDYAQQAYYDKHNSNLLVDYVNKELEIEERIVVENDHWLVVTPFWASWPFETLLLPKRHIARMAELSEAEKNSLADVLQQITIRYDNLFQCSFPYSLGWHGAPGETDTHLDIEHWQLHAHFYPPLLRSATVKKFMVGFEMLAETQRDMTPEQAAKRLRYLPAIHYKKALLKK